MDHLGIDVHKRESRRLLRRPASESGTYLSREWGWCYQAATRTPRTRRFQEDIQSFWIALVCSVGSFWVS